MNECDKKKYFGRVEISGKIYLNEYYSRGGNSDADTFRLYTTPDSIKFRTNENENWLYSLHLFDNAFIYNEADGKRTKIITKNNDKNQNYIKIRLQGIDAPDPHYALIRRSIPLRDIFSKYMSLKELFNLGKIGDVVYKRAATYLEQFAVNEDMEKVVHVNATSSINAPSDLFDRYGRAIRRHSYPRSQEHFESLAS